MIEYIVSLCSSEEPVLSTWECGQIYSGGDIQ